MVGVPIDANEYVLERATEVVKDGGVDRLARCLANMLDKQSAALVAIESLGQRTSYFERVLDTGMSLEVCSGADNGAPWAYEKIRVPGTAEAQSFFQQGCPEKTTDIAISLASPRATFDGSEMVTANVCGSEASVFLK